MRAGRQSVDNSRISFCPSCADGILAIDLSLRLAAPMNETVAEWRSHPAHGKWAVAGVPKKGWVCLGVEDLEQERQTCGMCEKEKIRYVQHMWHADYPEVLPCGCVCASHMEQDYVSARKREQRMKRRARRTSSWLDMKNWHLSRSGNWIIRKNGYRMVVYGPPGRLQVAVTSPECGETTFGRKYYECLRDAQLGTLVAFEWAQRHPV